MRRVVELRCRCNAFFGELLPASGGGGNGGVLRFKCRRCSAARRRPVVLLFLAADGRMIGGMPKDVPGIDPTD